MGLVCQLVFQPVIRLIQIVVSVIEFILVQICRLIQELDRQILPDGGHISRNPGALVDLLLDLLPLRRAFAPNNIVPPPGLNNAIDRMMPMLRFFRHGDGNFALFNGMGPTPGDLVNAVLFLDDARGTPVANATHSGYQRLQAGDAAGALPLLQQAARSLDGTSSIGEAYNDYNLAVALAQTSGCSPQVLDLLDRSQQIQGHRKEIDRLRKACRKAG